MIVSEQEFWGDWVLSCRLTKCSGAEPQIKYSHERDCNERQCVTELNSLTHSVLVQLLLLGFYIHFYLFK